MRAKRRVRKQLCGRFRRGQVDIVSAPPRPRSGYQLVKRFWGRAAATAALLTLLQSPLTASSVEPIPASSSYVPEPCDENETGLDFQLYGLVTDSIGNTVSTDVVLKLVVPGKDTMEIVTRAGLFYVDLAGQVAHDAELTLILEPQEIEGDGVDETFPAATLQLQLGTGQNVQFSVNVVREYQYHDLGVMVIDGDF